MTFETFAEAIHAGEAPAGVRPELRALWYDARGDWNEAHRVVQDLETSEAAWVHAYLHRKEGDHANAGYWYRRSGRPASTVSLEVEWEQIVKSLL